MRINISFFSVLFHHVLCHTLPSIEAFGNIYPTQKGGEIPGEAPSVTITLFWQSRPCGEVGDILRQRLIFKKIKKNGDLHNCGNTNRGKLHYSNNLSKKKKGRKALADIEYSIFILVGVK